MSTPIPYDLATRTLAGETVVVLYQLDLNPIGVNDIYNFTQNVNDGSQTSGGAYTGNQISFLGQQFTGIDLEVSGFEWSGTGAAPQPTVTFSNVNRYMSGLVVSANDLIGARLVRYRTFARYLDGASDASQQATSYQTDIFTVAQKTKHDKRQIEFRLKSVIDQQGRMLPRRLVLRDTCGLRYRRWNPIANSGSGAWDYTLAMCPYVGSPMYDVNGNPVGSPLLDRASQKFATCCKVRYGAGPYPFGGFPGVDATH